MAHVVHSINMTVSGLCHHTDAVADDEHHEYALNLLASAQALVLGRNTFDLFVSFWPGATARADHPLPMTRLAAALESVRKYVVSGRPVETSWTNTTRLEGPELNEVLDSITGHVVVFGSPGLGASLAAERLVDEVHVVVQPFIGALGPQAFAGLRDRRRLELLEAHPFRSGAVLLRYGCEPLSTTTRECSRI